MFDSLADRIREDEHVSASQRYMTWAAVLLISCLIFGGLIFVVRYFEK